MAFGEAPKLNEAAASQALRPADRGPYTSSWTPKIHQEWGFGSIKALHEAAAAHEAEMAEQLADHWAEQAGFRVLSI